MQPPYNFNSLIFPEKNKVIGDFDKKSKYIVKLLAITDLEKSLFLYSKNFYKAANKITDYLISLDHPDIGKLDSYIFAIAFLYRHCIELGLKAIGFQFITALEERKTFVHDTRHNLSEILKILVNKSIAKRPQNEIIWLQKYFDDLSRTDRESDSFRYPFHIVWESDDWETNGKFNIKRIFTEQTHIDLIKFVNKFEAAYEIIENWYLDKNEASLEWKDVDPVFIETGGNYYEQSVVGYNYRREDFYPYAKAYLETANYLKWYIKNKTDSGNTNIKDSLFLPMCYLYRNCVELSLKTIWFEEIGENFQKKCKVALDRKHSIQGMWKVIKPFVINYTESTDNPTYIDVIEDYCSQVHTLDGDANKFRYPMTNTMQPYFSTNKRFDFLVVGDFFEALNNILDGIDGELNAINEYKAEMESEMQAYFDY